MVQSPRENKTLKNALDAMKNTPIPVAVRTVDTGIGMKLPYIESSTVGEVAGKFSKASTVAKDDAYQLAKGTGNGKHLNDVPKIKEIEVNIAYRWFLGLSLEDPVPHFSTFGKNYTRRFKGTDLFEKIFYEILEQCIAEGIVDTSEVFIDSTHIKAHANRNKKESVEVMEQAVFYTDKLTKEITKNREKHLKKPLKETNAESKTSLKKKKYD